MEYAVIMSGFGGQGVLMMGDLLAYSAMKAGLNVTWMPSYGVEMRGGAANCTVVFSPEKIGSPIIETPDAVLAMNLPAMEKFQSQLPPGGLLFVNSTIVGSVDEIRSDIESIHVPTQEIAESVADKKMSNMAMLGAFLGKSEVFSLEFIDKCLESFLPPEREKLRPHISEALGAGAQYITEKYNHSLSS